MKSQCIVWIAIIALALLLLIPALRTRDYMVPASITVVYIFLNQYPDYARFASKRKITYEDLEDFRVSGSDDPELRKRFQVVFTRIQQIGGALCGGIIVLYGFHVFDSNPSLIESVGLLGGLLSLYAKVFGYIGSLSITCLDRMKRQQQTRRTRPDRPTQDQDPHSPKPQYAKQNDSPP